MDLTNEDVADLLALLDSLCYDELDLQTARFRLTLRRTPDGWTQSAQVASEPSPLEPAAAPDPQATGSMEHGAGYNRPDGASSRSGVAADVTDGTNGETEGSGEADGAIAVVSGVVGEAEVADGELVAVRAPLPGTFYRAPRPGAAPFVEVGSRVGADTVVGIVETMKLMNSVHAGAAGTVAEICLGNAEFAAHGATLLRIRADP